MALVIFDLDETLIDGDCSSLWSQRMASLGWVDTESFVRRDQQMMAAYARGELAMEEYMRFTLEPLMGRSVEEVEREVDTFVEDVIEPLIFSEACATLARHRAAGDRPLVVSASGVHLVSPIAARIGIEEVLAIDLEILNGHYTGHTTGTLTFREGKVLRLLDLLDGNDAPLADAHFYSDSRNDLPLLKLVGHPHTVNPDPVLREYAETNGWDILAWR
ncbi:MAG: putative phosphatase [Pseudomonas citronellolis]|nr:MAG: putative phosphatase [Pseudomonas citronellolis]